MTIDPRQRFTRDHRCPICDGWESAQRGHGVRCYGFLSSDGKYAHCVRSEHAGALPLNINDDTYAHRLAGPCDCGREHGPAEAPVRAPARAATPTPSVPKREGKSVEKSAKKAHPLAHYLYRDENGKVLFQIVRYEPKTFRPYRAVNDRPDPKKAGHWKMGLDGTRRVLYRLPELLAADINETVWLTEGEKDCDRAASHGLVATTNPSGAKTFDDAIAAPLAGRHVVILGDNDPAGIAGAEKKKGILQPICASVRVLIFSDLPPGGDLVDYLDSGKTVEDLRNRAQPSPEEGLPSMMTAADLLRRELPPAAWAIPGILPEGLVLLVGPPKKGKSWLSLSTALGIAWGGRVLGQLPVEQGEVLYLALEDSPRRLQDRLRRLCEDMPAPEKLYLALDWPRVDDGGLEHLHLFLKEHPKTRFVIVDTLKRVRPVVGANKSVYDADYEALQGLQGLAAYHHVAILVVHHSRKADAIDPMDTISGSNGLLAAADGAWILERKHGTNDAILYVVHREGEDQELALTWSPALVTWELRGDAEEYRGTRERRDILETLSAADEPMTPREIAEALGRDSGSTKVLLFKMKRDEEVRTVGRGMYVRGKTRLPAVTGNLSDDGILVFPRPDAENGQSRAADDGYQRLPGDEQIDAKVTEGYRPQNGQFPRPDAKNEGKVTGLPMVTGFGQNPEPTERPDADPEDDDDDEGSF